MAYVVQHWLHQVELTESIWITDNDNDINNNVAYFGLALNHCFSESQAYKCTY